MNTKLKQCCLLAAALATAILLAGCTDGMSKPSESSARQTIEEQIQKNSQGKLKLRDFKKTNGIEREIFGQKMYELQYEAVIEPLANCWFIEPNSTSVKARISEPYVCLQQCSFCSATPLKKGELHKVNGSIHYEMTEKGWVMR